MNEEQIQNQNANANTEEKVREVFAKLDIDGNGFIEKNELTVFLKDTLGEYFQEQYVDEFLQQFDTDNDGRISFEELFDFVTKKEGGI